jgi:hypothetical protein
MLVFTPFALCFITLCGIFMRFPELTYWQDAIVPVPCFLLFLCFRKATQEIFSELDETSSQSLIFPGSFPKTERKPEGGQRPPSHVGGTAQPLAAPTWCDAMTQHTTVGCSMQVVDITLMKLHSTNITSLRVVQQKHCGSSYKVLLLQAQI